MTELEQIRQRVREISWWQAYEIMPGVMTTGIGDMLGRLHNFEIPEDLHGKRVLDIGCNDGFFTFLAEERGAEVVAIDSWPRRGYFLAAELRGSRSTFHHLSVYDLTAERLGLFDIVFYFGVHYHLKHPLLALERIAAITKEYALIETEIETNPIYRDASVSHFYLDDALNQDPSNWWTPTLSCLQEMTKAAGFPLVTLLHCYEPRRAVIRADKGPHTSARPLTEDFFIALDAQSSRAAIDRPMLITGWAISQMRPTDGIQRILVYLDELDDPGALLGEATHRIHRADLALHFGDHYAASGFQFLLDPATTAHGSHTLYFMAEGDAGWNVRSLAVTIGVDKPTAPAEPMPQPTLATRLQRILRRNG